MSQRKSKRGATVKVIQLSIRTLGKYAKTNTHTQYARYEIWHSDMAITALSHSTYSTHSRGLGRIVKVFNTKETRNKKSNKTNYNNNYNSQATPLTEIDNAMPSHTHTNTYHTHTRRHTWDTHTHQACYRVGKPIPQKELVIIVIVQRIMTDINVQV